jgi:hypothetical protein
MQVKRRFLNRWVIFTFVFLAFICGLKFNSVLLKPAKPVETIDINRYEADFRDIHKLISQNTLAVYGIADAITNGWINSLALKQDSSRQIEKIFSDLENSGARTALIENNKKIEDAMTRLNDCPLKYLEAYKVLEDTYILYLEFYKFTLNPPDTLIIYAKRITELEGELAKSFRLLFLYAPKEAAERPQAGTQLALAETAVLPATTKRPDKPQEASHSLIKLDDILGKSSSDLEKMMGQPQFETRTTATGGYQKEYMFNGRRVNVYFREDQVTGLSN